MSKVVEYWLHTQGHLVSGPFVSKQEAREQLDPGEKLQPFEWIEKVTVKRKRLLSNKLR